MAAGYHLPANPRKPWGVQHASGEDHHKGWGAGDVLQTWVPEGDSADLVYSRLREGGEQQSQRVQQALTDQGNRNKRTHHDQPEERAEVRQGR